MDPSLNQNADWLSTPQPKKPSRIPYVATIISVAIIVAAVLVVTTLSKPGCLTTADYEALTGVKYTGTMQPTELFYTTPIAFSTTENSTLTKGSSGIIDAFSAFYKNRPNKSMHFTVDGTYSSGAQTASSNERVVAIQRALVSAGIPSTFVTTNQPSLVVREEDDSEITESYTISITSFEGCR